MKHNILNGKSNYSIIAGLIFVKMYLCASMRWLLHTSTYMRAQGTLGQYACQKVPCMYVLQMVLEFLNMYMLLLGDKQKHPCQGKRRLRF